jgi:hypothetical protein
MQHSQRLKFKFAIYYYIYICDIRNLWGNALNAHVCELRASACKNAKILCYMSSVRKATCDCTI